MLMILHLLTSDSIFEIHKAICCQNWFFNSMKYIFEYSFINRIKKNIIESNFVVQGRSEGDCHSHDLRNTRCSPSCNHIVELS